MENINGYTPIALRKMTRSVAQLLTLQLQEHLTALAPLMRPASFLGDFVVGSAKGSQSSLSRTASEFIETFHGVMRSKPFNDDDELKPPLDISSTRIEVHPFQYRHNVTRAEGAKTVAVVCPLKLVLSYSGYGFTGLSSLVVQRGAPREAVRLHVLHAILLNFAVTRQPGCAKLLQGLRYQVSTCALPEFGGLPVTCIDFGIPTVRPSDETIVELTDYSGMDQVEEVLDPAAISGIRDPFRERVAAVVGVLSGLRGAA